MAPNPRNSFDETTLEMEELKIIDSMDSFADDSIDSEDELILDLKNIELAFGPEKKSKPKYRVSFSDVEVREYELDICDNPACSLGPAIAIGWNYEVASKESLDDYEKNRPPLRPRSLLKMSRYVRETIMRESKFSTKEIRQHTNAKARIVSSRISTKANLPFAEYEEKLENAKRKCKRILLRKKKDEDLLKLWPEYEAYSLRKSTKIRAERRFSMESVTMIEEFDI